MCNILNPSVFWKIWRRGSLTSFLEGWGARMAFIWLCRTEILNNFAVSKFCIKNKNAKRKCELFYVLLYVLSRHESVQKVLLNCYEIGKMRIITLKINFIYKFLAVYCSLIDSVVDNGVVECHGGVASGESNIFGSTCVLLCDGGWIAEGVARTKCNSKGEWTASLGRCRSEI